MSLLSQKTSKQAPLVAIVAAVLWILTAQFYIVQAIVANAWQNPPYKIRDNFISNLGAVTCDERVCSPLYALMNVSFVVLGLLILMGSLLFTFNHRQNNGAVIGFLCLAVSGFSTIFVGLFPIDTEAVAHGTAAFSAFLIGNAGLVILGITLKDYPGWLRLVAVILGCLALLLLPFYVNEIYLGIGVGYMQRPIAYAQTIFMICFGAHTLFRIKSPAKNR